MPKINPIIEISGFEWGMLDDISTPARNGFNFCAGLDIHREIGTLQVSDKFTVIPVDKGRTNVQFSWMVQYGSTGTVYGFERANSDSKRWISEYSSGSPSWGTVRKYNGPSQVNGGMCEFNNKLYWAAGDDFGSYNGTTWVNSVGSFSVGTAAIWPSIGSNAAGWHPMAVLGTKLCIGDGNYLYTLDTDGVSDGSAIAIPSGELIKCSAVYGNLLYFGTVKKNVNEGKIYSWDGFSPEPQPIISLAEYGIHALKVWKNRLMIFAGLAGNLYEFNGATQRKVKTIPGIGTQGNLNPGVVAEYNGNLLFGLSNHLNYNKDYSGLFTFGNKSEKLPEALTFQYLPSYGTIKGIRYSSLVSVDENSTNVFIVSYDDSQGTSFSNILTPGTPGPNPIVSGTFGESQVYDVSLAGEKRAIKGVEIIARPLATGNSIGIKYKKDNAYSWTSLGTINSSNQGDILFGSIGLAKTFQVALNFDITANPGTDTFYPEVFSIKIY